MAGEAEAGEDIITFGGAASDEEGWERQEAVAIFARAHLADRPAALRADIEEVLPGPGGSALAEIGAEPQLGEDQKLITDESGGPSLAVGRGFDRGEIGRANG